MYLYILNRQFNISVIRQKEQIVVVEVVVVVVVIRVIVIIIIMSEFYMNFKIVPWFAMQ